ncbi:heat shock protein transcriptional repressor HspR [Microbacterium amylolyticum]|uniref:MerR family transcriptional regulator/heat shock protein HspR n=1 Tax=Microbacterium amylolyticum TaxID=936337 RepID=A0ABS4ZGT2_9MICO|nr:MerR family transcriptional regulator [Microbacterium amylolyticum]MBP2436490.1 MerR family transcriptional regulator/heat shock protein HspR [Microbacterium amylolyticum]
MQLPEGVSPTDPIFPIAAASELAGMHPQTLRQYDRIGLVVPGRTRGGSRRYSAYNIVQLQEVAKLSAEGVPLAVIQRMIDLENEVQHLRDRVRDLTQELREERETRPGARVFATNATGGVVTLTGTTRIRRQTDVVLWRPPRG